MPTIPDAGSSTQKWPRLKAASDAQQGVGSNKAGTVGRAPPWMASIPCKVPGLNLVGNEVETGTKHGPDFRLSSLTGDSTHMENCCSHILTAPLPLSCPLSAPSLHAGATGTFLACQSSITPSCSKKKKGKKKPFMSSRCS